MKTTFKIILASLLASACASSSSGPRRGNAPIGPDFVASAPRLHIDGDLVASPQMNRIEPLDVIAFDLDSENLSDETYAQVDRAASWLKRHPRHRVVLEGHTDLLGVQPYNEQLATRRMEAVKNRLLAWGISSDRILLLTYGESDAIMPNNPEDRRVVMFATDAPVQHVLAMQSEHRPALIATWTERGTRLQMQQGVGDRAQPSGIISRR